MQKNKQKLHSDIGRMLAQMDSTGRNGETEDQEEIDTNIPDAPLDEPAITLHVHEFTDGVFLTTHETLDFDETEYIDTALAGTPTTGEPEPEPQHAEKSSGDWLAYAPIIVLLLIIFSSLAFQLHLIFNPPTATITIIPKSAQVSLSATLSTGRILTPITLSQTASASASGRGHQDPKQATGAITFYNGQLNSVFIPAGTPFTSNDGVQVVTDQDANIPAASPPIEGQVAVPAHAVNAGSGGNIPARDINTACCATAVLAINLTAFQGGQDERNFHFVTKSDIENAAIPLKAALTQSVTAALQTQLKQNEQLQALPCAPQVSADHNINEEASQVKVTATLTCSGVAYNENTLQQPATQLLTSQALRKLGSGYSLYGTIQVAVERAIPTRATPTLVLSLTGIWTYALSDIAQQQIKDLVKGKPYHVALHELLSLPGIEKVSIAWDENTKLPKDPKYIHLVLITGV